MGEVNPHLISGSTFELLAQARQRAGADVAQIDRAIEAARLASLGQLDRALDAMEGIVASSTDLAILFLGFQFFFRTGDLARAEELVRWRLAIAERREDQEQVARACTNLGTLLLVAERAAESRPFLERAVAIDESRGDARSVARDTGNLANYFEHVGDLERAEQLNCRALAMAEELKDEELMAGRLANLGDIAKSQGHHEKARELWRAAADRFTSLGLDHYAHEVLRKLQPRASATDER